MSIQQLRARLDALKRRYALPLLILRLRRRAENLCQLWDTADIAERSHNQPFPDVVLMVPDFARDGPLLPPLPELYAPHPLPPKKPQHQNPPHPLRHRPSPASQQNPQNRPPHPHNETIPPRPLTRRRPAP